MTANDYDYDIAIIGGGGAGLAAAVTAHEKGARSIIIVDSQPLLGGSTRLSGGVFYAAGTSVQRAAGIEHDTPDRMFHYYMTLNQWKVEPALVRALCDDAAPTLEWLIDHGVMFEPEDLYQSGVEDGIARGHAPVGFGAAIVAALEGVVDGTEGIDVALGKRVDRLIVEDGRVVGLQAGDEILRARQLIMTTGGFGRDPEMLAEHYPEAARGGDWTWSISAEGCVGDGLRLGDQVGAIIKGHDRGLLLITPGFFRELEVDPPGWLVYVDAVHGRRFVDESAAYSVMAGVFNDVGGRAWALFDDEMRRNAHPGDKYADAFAAGIVAANFVPDVLDQMIEKGRVLREDSLEDLGQRLGLPEESLVKTVADYNADVERGQDGQFFKPSEWLQPLATPPYHAVEMRPAIVCLTSKGVLTDAEARVVGHNGLPIPGLLAAGETTGGVLGERYVGGGNAVSNAIVFGRIAGRTAAHACDVDRASSTDAAD